MHLPTPSLAAPRRPWQLPALAAAWGVAEDLSAHGSAPLAFQLATSVAAAALLCGRRRAPLVAATAFVILLAVRGAAGAQSDVAITPLQLLPVYMYAIARHAGSPARAIAGGALVAAAVVASTALVGPFTDVTPLQRLFLVVVLATGWGAGWAVWQRWHLALLARHDHAELERTAAAAVRRARLAERERIASELEAVVSAAVARIARAAADAAAAVDRGAATADARLAETQRMTRETTHDLRRLLHLLRVEQDERPSAGGEAEAGEAGGATAAKARPDLWFLLVSLAVPVLGTLEAVAVDAPAATGPRLAGVALSLPVVLARRRAPVAAAAAGALLVAARAALGHLGATGFSQIALLALLAWSAGRWARPPGGAVGVACTVAGVIAALAAAGGAVVNDYAMLVLVVGLSGVAGDALRRRGEELDASRRDRDRALDARATALARTLDEERRRLARELHDVLGHSLSLLMVYAGAVRVTLRRDPRAARAHARTMQIAADAATAELGDLRALIGERGGPAGAAPSLEDVRALVAEAARVVPATLDMRCGPVPPSIGLTGYRITQEALSNARKHAPGAPVAVSLRTDGEALRISIRNGPPQVRPQPGPGGHGVVGMEERARLYGGELRAAPVADGGWEVSAIVPLGDGPEAQPRVRQLREGAAAEVSRRPA